MWEGGAVIGYLAVMGVGYVFGTKAGRRREQIVGTYRAVAGNPATKVDHRRGRRKIASKVSPDGDLATFTEIDASTTVIAPRRSTSTSLVSALFWRRFGVIQPVTTTLLNYGNDELRAGPADAWSAYDPGCAPCGFKGSLSAEQAAAAIARA